MNNNSQNPPKIILVVEDEQVLSDLYVDKFELSGYKVLRAPNGEKALEMLKDQPIDFVVLDVMLPQLSGIEVLKRMHVDDKMKDIPVLVLTNVAETSEKEVALKNGAKGYLLKAMQTPEQVVEKVKDIIGGPDVSYDNS